MPPYKPPLSLQTSTLWEYPSQHYGEGFQGDPRYVGATPSYVIWNLLQRYTRATDLVIDPFCGSGTTLDVARDLGRTARGFDLAPYRSDIEAADARALPLEDASVDFVFMDPPYSDHLVYSDDPRCIGKLSATEAPYFEALEQAFAEAWRVLRDRRFAALYICDFHARKQGFVPIGARCLVMLGERFRIVDHVCVTRHNKALREPRRQKAAEEDNTFLRGFNHLIIVKKELGAVLRAGSRTAEAAVKPRGGGRTTPGRSRGPDRG